MAGKKPTKDEMIQEIAILDRVTNALNTAIVAMMFIYGVKGDELNNVKAEDYVKYVTEHVHPLMREADRIVKEAGELAQKEINEEIDKAEKEKK